MNLLIKHVSRHIFSCCDKTKCTGCWNSQTMHCFTAKELSDATTEHSKAICKPAVRSLPSTFKLQFPPFRLRINYLSKSYCPTITQLSSPHPKLMPSIALSIGQAVQMKINQGWMKSYQGLDYDSCNKNLSENTYAPAKGSAPENKRGKSGLSNLKFQNKIPLLVQMDCDIPIADSKDVDLGIIHENDVKNT